MRRFVLVGRAVGRFRGGGGGERKRLVDFGDGAEVVQFN